MPNGSRTNYFVHPLLRAHDWQHRPEFDRVAAWWKSGGRGVCALVGMGGAGKTAIAERFLRVLPGVLPEDPDVAKDQSLPSPHSTFVFSFYADDKPENFFAALQMWLERTPRVSTILSVTQMLFLLQQTPGLVVLDGLERVQQDGSRGMFGRLTSPKLREFLDHLAGGYVPTLSVLVTSRFPLADLRDKHPRFFHLIPIDQIEVATGVQLLRDRGVRGTDARLAGVVEECGRHALTVDLAGGYIAEYGRGDPATPLRLRTDAATLQAEAEEELDEDRRAVLEQGRRFARVAERYRDAMLKTDEAAIALLERICLFRLGVTGETLAAIFTGPAAEKVSGPALAGLTAAQLQKKLDWLVRLRIVEQSESSSGLSTLDSRPSTLYSIHPAVRDGFLSGIAREAALASHEAVRHGLENNLKVSLGGAPGMNPSDPATLDVLEEIVHHTLQAGHVPEAWDIYGNRIGGYQNLLWRLGAYERGERICRAFAGGEPPESCFAPHEKSVEFAERTTTKAPYESLPEDQRAIFINEWGLYLMPLGRLATAARCHKLHLEIEMLRDDWRNASITNQNLCEVWLLSGRLSDKDVGGRMKDEKEDPLIHLSSFRLHPSNALSAAAEALRLAERADGAKWRYQSHAYRAHVQALRGEVPAALADFHAALDWQHIVDGDDDPLYSNRGFWHTHLLARLGRREEATRLTEANKEILKSFGGDYQIPNCNLVLADMPGESLAAASRLCQSARDWASERDAKEVLCWSALVAARIELQKAREEGTGGNRENREDRNSVSSVSFCSNSSCSNHLAAGLKIARDCGFGLFHIDLLLERARVHLLRGDPQAALDDIELALDKSTPADEATGQPELLAANDPACGYAWPIPVGLQLRAEALLLQAAQRLGTSRVDAVGNAHATIQQLIDDAEHCLNDALELWRLLRDPVRKNANFRHPKTRKQYNYRAAETWRVLQDLAGGLLTNYPLQSTREAEPEPTAIQPLPRSAMSNRFHIALSFPGEHREFVLEVANVLATKLTRDRVFYDEWYEAELLGAGGDLKLQAMYEQADLVVPFFSQHYDKPWCSMEWETIRGILLNRRKADAVIPVHLDETKVPGWPAVNFGIPLRGRSPREIADVVLQALAPRLANVAKDEAGPVPSAVERLRADLTELSKREPVVWLASLVRDCYLRTPAEIDENYDFDELKTSIEEAEELVSAGESQAGDAWAKKNSLQAVTLVAVGLAHTIPRSPRALLLITEVCETMLGDEKIKLRIAWPAGAKDKLYSMAVETNDRHDDSICRFLHDMCER